MCIIINRPAQHNVPEEWIRESFRCNNDGAGIVYPGPEGLIVKKGIFDVDELMREIKQAEGKDLIIHCRVTSRGPTNKENTHPFVFDAFKGRFQFAVAHNGTLDWKPAAGESDTATFVRAFLAEHFDADPWFLDRWTGGMFMEAMIGRGNKMAVMRFDREEKKHEVYLVNEKDGQAHEKDGCWYSNYSYLPVRVEYDVAAHRYYGCHGSAIDVRAGGKSPAQDVPVFLCRQWGWNEARQVYVNDLSNEALDEPSLIGFFNRLRRAWDVPVSNSLPLAVTRRQPVRVIPTEPGQWDYAVTTQLWHNHKSGEIISHDLMLQRLTAGEMMDLSWSDLSGEMLAAIWQARQEGLRSRRERGDREETAAEIAELFHLKKRDRIWYRNFVHQWLVDAPEMMAMPDCKDWPFRDKLGWVRSNLRETFEEDLRPPTGEDAMTDEELDEWVCGEWVDSGVDVDVIRTALEGQKEQ